MVESEAEAGGDFCHYCSGNFPESELSVVVTEMNGVERKERVCDDCEEEARGRRGPAVGVVSVSNPEADSSTEPPRATEVREILSRIEERGYENEIKDFNETIEDFAREVVEQGAWVPDCSVTAEVPLTLRERITGTRQQDMTAMLIIGAMLGSALERDVPADSDAEDDWREGDFVLPESHD